MLDTVWSREPDNIARLVAALDLLSPRLHGAPEGLPFRLDARTITSGLNFTLSTDAGPITLLGEVTGSGGYPQFAPTRSPLACSAPPATWSRSIRSSCPSARLAGQQT